MQCFFDTILKCLLNYYRSHSLFILRNVFFLISVVFFSPKRQTFIIDFKVIVRLICFYTKLNTLAAKWLGYSIITKLTVIKPDVGNR